MPREYEDPKWPLPPPSPSLLCVVEVADVDWTFLVALTSLGEVGQVVEGALGKKYDVPWLCWSLHYELDWVIG